jgi:hypothetical protein
MIAFTQSSNLLEQISIGASKTTITAASLSAATDVLVRAC